MALLDAYTGSWTHKEARHLLRRTTFGPTQDEVETATTLGLESTLTALFTITSLADKPVKTIPDGTGTNELNDPGALYGETWVNAAPFPNVNPPMLRNRVLRARSKSMYSWASLQMHRSSISLVEKMTLFWHNHFVVGNGTIAHREYNYFTLLRSHALGNFKQLTKDITVDTSMLIYLSGTENTDAAPNENYSRELLELFTIGKGPLAGPGDYTHYTEQDVEVMARVLTGWNVTQISDPDTLTAQFSNNRHTKGTKTLSARFSNAQIAENGADEYKDLIDVIFLQDECAKFIVRKLYRWFVNYDIDTNIESNVITPLATILRNNNYEIAVPLKVLLKSEHFFNSTACMIKSPIDLIYSASRGLSVSPSQTDIAKEYDYAYNLYIMAADMDQAMFAHPNVAGWKAYYQEPQYYKTWINNLLLPKRHTFCQLMIEGGNFTYNDERYTVTDLVPVLDIAESITDSTDPNTLIQELGNRMFNYPISTSQITSLKEVLIGGLPDFEWTVEFGGYLSDKNNMALKTSAEKKLKALLTSMVRMSEFQIM